MFKFHTMETILPFGDYKDIVTLFLNTVTWLQIYVHIASYTTPSQLHTSHITLS